MQSATLFSPAKQLSLNASGGQASLAVIAITAIGRERGADALSDRKLADAATDRDDFPDELVAHRSARIDPDFPTKVWMQVAATQAGESDTNDGVAIIPDRWFG
jgi:hypothetical protein